MVSVILPGVAMPMSVSRRGARCHRRCGTSAFVVSRRATTRQTVRTTSSASAAASPDMAPGTANGRGAPPLSTSCGGTRWPRWLAVLRRALPQGGGGSGPSCRSATPAPSVEIGCPVGGGYGLAVAGAPRLQVVLKVEEGPAELCITRRFGVVDDLERRLQFAMVAYVAGSRRVLSMDRVKEMLESTLDIAPELISVHRHCSEDFLMVFSSAALRNRVSACPSIEDRGDRLVFRPWNRQSQAVHSIPGFKVWLELEGIPPHAWDRLVVEDLLGSSCKLDAVASRQLPARTCPRSRSWRGWQTRSASLRCAGWRFRSRARSGLRHCFSTRCSYTWMR